MPETVPVRVPMEIRWRDLDALGHVNNAVYLRYLEYARMEYVRSLLGDAPLLDDRTPLPRDFQFIMAEISISYRSPAMLGDQLVIELYVSKTGHKSFVFEYQITEQKSGRLIATACSTQVWYDYAARESRLVPEEMITRMETLQGRPIPRS
jgi:acyl-CoA thioester hydrolase